MTLFKRPLLAVVPILLTLLFTACSSGSGSGGGGTPTGVTVTGTARAPAGAVALFEREPALLAALDFVLAPAAAAITGLDPVSGATVELIRVDRDGNQLGDVLATTATSLTGEYTLVVPAGVNLAGDLIVRITGTGGAKMRAQVVRQTVDISPVSEFVLRKFIAQGTDLGTLETNSVIRLTGQVEEFDLSGTADLDSMLAALEQETGEFVDSQIEVIASAPGDTSTAGGQYRYVFRDWGLHDDDQQHGVGTFATDLDLAEMTITDNGAGALGIAVGSAEVAYTNQTSSAPGTANVSFNVEIDTAGETITGRLDAARVLSIESPFEEQIDGDFGWRWPPALIRLQKARNTNLFIGTEASAGVRYLAVDTNSDGVKDAVDPAQREGDEVFRGWNIAAQTPSAATAADLDGDFGRVFFSTRLTNTGHAEVQSESNILSFDGAGAVLNVAATQSHLLGRSGYTVSTEAAQNGLAFTLAANGDVETIGGAPVDGFVNASFDFLAITDATSDPTIVPSNNVVNEVTYETTLAVKLPGAQLDLSNRAYRVLFVGVGLGATSTTLASTRFDSTFTVNNDGISGAVVSRMREIEKATMSAEVVANDDAEPSTVQASMSLAANGATTITVTDGSGTTTLEGYFSHDGSLGIFQSRDVDSGASDPSELGIVVLVQL